MSRPAAGRTRRTVFIVFSTLTVFVGLAGAGLLVLYWRDPNGNPEMVPLLKESSEPLIWQVMAGLAGVVGLLAALSYGFSFDTRASRRPRVGLMFTFLATGLLLGSAAEGLLASGAGVGSLSPEGIGLLAGCTVGIPLLWLGFEAAVAGILGSLVKGADRAKKRRRAFVLSRLLLLFRPGKTETLRSVALERFRRGDRSGQIAQDLQGFFDTGDHQSEEVVEALCRLAAEQRDPARYLFFLTRLHLLRPDDEDLTEALIEENLAQDHQAEALRLIEAKGVGDRLEEQQRHAYLLLELGQAERAVDLAADMARMEGIPFQVSGDLLRRVLELRPKLHAALNLLGEQATLSRNLDRAIRRFEQSLEVNPNQPDIKMRLLDLYRETQLLDRLETLLSQLVRDPKTNQGPAMEVEYADVLVTNKKIPEAQEFLAERVKRSPNRFLLLDRYAEVLCTVEEWKEAAEINERALGQAESEDERARARSRTARIERALLTAEVYDLQQEVEAHPRDGDLAIQLIRRLVESNQVERAIAQADSLVRRLPDARGQVKKTLSELGLRPDGPFILLSYLADLYLEDSEYQNVVDLIEPLRIRSLTPDAVEADLCQKILHRVPNHLESLRRVGDINRREHRFAEMVHYYVLYVAHGGKSTEEINHALFEAYENLGDYANAKSYALGLMEHHAEDDNIPFRLATLAFKATQLEDALHYARLSVERNKRNMDAERLIKKVDRILREQLSATLQKQLEEGKTSPEDLETLADLYFSLGNVDKAIPLFQRAARDPSRSVRSKAKLALCLAEKGLFDIANETIAGIEVVPESEDTEEILDLLYQIAGHFEAERLLEKAGRIYKTVFLVDAGYRDVVKKIEKYT